MCNLDKYKEIVNSELSDEEKLEELRIEATKDNIVTFLDENPDIFVSFESLGLTEEDFKKAPSYEIDEDDFNIGREEFKKKEEFKITTLYLYDSYAYGAKGYGSNSRPFCVKLATRSRSAALTYNSILRLNGSNPGFGQEGSNSYSVFLYRGGKNCKHFWTKYYYDPDSKGLIKAPNSAQPKQIDKGSVGGAPE